MRYYTVEEIADLLSVNVRTVRRWIKEKALTGVKLGDRAGWRITDDDLEAFLAKRRAAAETDDEQSPASDKHPGAGD